MNESEFDRETTQLLQQSPDRLHYVVYVDTKLIQYCLRENKHAKTFHYEY